MPDALPGNFQPTRWSLVIQSRGEGEQARRALEDLCRAYWFPLYAWGRRFGASPEDAEDFVQGFFVQVINKQLFSEADRDMGKLRTFLLTAFSRHVYQEQRKAARQKRGGGQVISFDAMEAEEWYTHEKVEGESPDQMFDRQWALTLLDHALGRIESQAAAKGKAAEFEAMRPFLTGEAAEGEHQRVAERLGMSMGAFKVAMHRLRGKFREALRHEVRETQPGGSNVEEEMAYLLQVLRAAQG
jgi:RNA polymerase sigma factor (sigma-70 family)